MINNYGRIGEVEFKTNLPPPNVSREASRGVAAPHKERIIKKIKGVLSNIYFIIL